MISFTRRVGTVGGLALSLTALCGAPALAQERLQPVDPPPAAEGSPPVQDLGGWLGEEDMQGGGDPLAPESDPMPPAPAPQADAGPAEPAPRSPEDERNRRRQINRNYDKALGTYEDLGAPGRDIGVLDRRIGNNERIVNSYSGRMNEAREQRRILQVELYNRMFFLRQQKEQGNIDDETFNRLSREAERNYADRAEALKGDLNAWRNEVSTAQDRLDSLRSERRMLEASRPRRSAPRGQSANQEELAPPPAGVRLLNSLESRLQQLDQFQTRHAMRGVDPRTVGNSSLGRPRAALPAENADGEAEDEDDGGWFDWF